MNAHDLPTHAVPAAASSDLAAPQRLGGVVVGDLLALTEDGSAALVRFSGQVGMAAVRARASIDLHGSHIGGSVVLMFEHGDPGLPIVVGVLRDRPGWPMDDKPAQVEIDADGLRLVVSAKQQLVLRCGKASVTLTKGGRILLEGTDLLSRSSGANRIKGGSVQIN